MATGKWQSAYLRLHPKAVLKRLERPFVYHVGRDELYEIDDRALDFLSRCNGMNRGEALTTDVAFVEYCVGEELLELLPSPDPVNTAVNEAVHPSLRYLELQLLRRCNLQCLHCYLGSVRYDDLRLADALRITTEFSSMGGLRLLISGGEPLLYKDLKQLIAQTANLGLRRVLFTNGTLLSTRNIEWLNVEEIQFSLDGWERGHDALRGKGAFRRTMRGVQIARDAGVAISFATMIHRDNLDEFPQMRDFLGQVGAIEWGIDLPAPVGSLEDHHNLLVPYEEAVPLMSYAYGGGYHGSSEGYACGRHLLTVFPDGMAAKCGFYREALLGDARQGLRDCWLRLEHTPLDRLECWDCSAVEECAGGCRFRASHSLGPDLFMCALYGVGK